jgi:excisionase family DNA binding protein
MNQPTHPGHNRPHDHQPGNGEQVAYRPRDAARLMGISRSQLYEELQARRITARKNGRATLIPAHEIARWLAALPEWHPQDPKNPQPR